MFDLGACRTIIGRRCIQKRGIPYISYRGDRLASSRVAQFSCHRCRCPPASPLRFNNCTLTLLVEFAGTGVPMPPAVVLQIIYLPRPGRPSSASSPKQHYLVPAGKLRALNRTPLTRRIFSFAFLISSSRSFLKLLPYSALPPPKSCTG